MRTYYLHTLNGKLAIMCGNGESAYFATEGIKKILLPKHGYLSRRELLRDQEKIRASSPSFYEGERLGYMMVRA